VEQIYDLHLTKPRRTHRRKRNAELRPYVQGENIGGISVSNADAKAGSPKAGDMIARQGRPTNGSCLPTGAASWQAISPTSRSDNPARGVTFPRGNRCSQKLLLRSTRNRWEGLMSQSGSMRFLLVSVGFALFFGSVAVALSAFSEGEWTQVVSTAER
jgi:hypothetical protein